MGKYDLGYKMATAGSSTTRVGPFEVTEDSAHRLGQGSYGTVYLARDTRDNKSVAAKRQEIWKEYQYMEGVDWENEAKMLRKISPHDSVVKILDFKAVEFVDNGIAKIAFWFITEYCEQRSLVEYAFKTELIFSAKLDILYQGASGVSHLHAENVVHHDLKPRNMVVTKNGPKVTIRLCDFGEATNIALVNDLTVAMKTSNQFGTPDFMSREQMDVQDGKLVYKKSVDTFGFGVTGLTLLESQKGKFMEPPTGKYQNKYITFPFEMLM